MKKFSFVTVVSSALAALAIGLASAALADAGSGANVPQPGVPFAVHPQLPASGTNPYIPVGIDPYVPYGVWAQQ